MMPLERTNKFSNLKMNSSNFEAVQQDLVILVGSIFEEEYDPLKVQ